VLCESEEMLQFRSVLERELKQTMAAMQAEFGTHISPVSLDVRWLMPNSLAICLLVRLSAIRFRIRCSPVVNRVISGREFSISRVRQPQRVDMVRASWVFARAAAGLGDTAALLAC